MGGAPAVLLPTARTILCVKKCAAEVTRPDPTCWLGCATTSGRGLVARARACARPGCARPRAPISPSPATLRSDRRASPRPIPILAHPRPSPPPLSCPATAPPPIHPTYPPHTSKTPRQVAAANDIRQVAPPSPAPPSRSARPPSFPRLIDARVVATWPRACRR